MYKQSYQKSNDITSFPKKKGTGKIPLSSLIPLVITPVVVF